MTRLVARVYDTAVRALSRLAIAWTPNVAVIRETTVACLIGKHTECRVRLCPCKCHQSSGDPLHDPDREYDERDISLWCKQWVAECEAITLGRWCAKSREGWCAIVPDTEPPEGISFVATVCGFGITLPGGFEHRQPDCPDCLAAAEAICREEA